MKIRARALGLAVGIVWGLGIFVATLWAVAGARGNTLTLLSAYYYGYDVSVAGAFIGFFWGLVHGFILGLLVAWVYNTMHKMLYKAEAPAS